MKFFSFSTSLSSTSIKSMGFCKTAQLEPGVYQRPQNEIRKTVDRALKIVCGHSNYSDIKSLLQQKNL